MINHINNIHIKHFKCLTDFEVKDLARVNLITGQNNVGKTALIEACYVNVAAQSIECFNSALRDIKLRRERLNLFADLRKHGEAFVRNKIIYYLDDSHGFEAQSNINHCSFHIKNNNGISHYEFLFNNQAITVNIKDYSYKTDFKSNIRFIDSLGYADHQIVKIFVAIQKLDKEEFLNKTLRHFDGSIEGFKIIDNKPECKINGQYREISELGDGTKHLITIIVSLFGSKDGYLFIDEIGNGIHYKKLDALWEVVLTISKEQSVQVFATTHSKECLESYARVAKKLADEDIALVELGKSEGKLQNIVFTADEVIDDILHQGSDIRGWG